MGERNNTDDAAQPRLLTKKAAAAYVGVSAPTFAKWVMEGVMPGPAGVTKMWDRKAIDLAIDKMSGISQAAQPIDDDQSFAAWKRKSEARKAEQRRLEALLARPSKR